MSLGEAIALACLTGYLLTLAAIDLRTRRLPNLLVYPGVVAALAAGPVLPSDGYLNAVAGAAASFALFATIYFVAAPGVLGGGDVKLAPVIGAALGLPETLYAFALGPLGVALIALPMFALGRWTLRTRVPYGPYLAAGAIGVAIAMSV